MSAFVVHDLKNLVSQLQLILRNARRHQANPDFQRDMLATVEHTVERMLLVAKGEARRAVDYLGRASRIAPDRADIRMNYAKALVRAGQKEAARRELEVLQAAPSEFEGKSEVASLLKTL